jgi:peroxiredoxin
MFRTLAVLAIAFVLSHPLDSGAVEVGQPAPEFSLPATTGTNVSLKDFRGKSWVLIEFYGADFVPT